MVLASSIISMARLPSMSTSTSNFGVKKLVLSGWGIMVKSGMVPGSKPTPTPSILFNSTVDSLRVMSLGLAKSLASLLQIIRLTPCPLWSASITKSGNPGTYKTSTTWDALDSVRNVLS